ncbi:MAG: acyl-CoA dehydrogenase family protein [Pseudomonadota bacterium]|nr:acyl-CoA dehydrogenase family protein [Pseudomonadota bacterium]
MRARLERNVDESVINGQKIRTSDAHYADRAILVTLSDPEAVKHKGLTYFFLNMKMPGIDVRPIRQVSGYSGFN